MCTGAEALLGAQIFGGVVGGVAGLKSLMTKAPSMPTVAQTDPVADDAKAKAAAEATAAQDRASRLKLARSASLLSNGGAAGDLSTANIATAGATSKQTLGA